MLAALVLSAVLAAGPASPAPLARVLRDADADGRPDAVGRTVTLAGRASVASWRLGSDPGFYLQDATGGVATHSIVERA